MALNISTTIRNMDQFSGREWVANGGNAKEYERLKAAQDAQISVRVDCEATDGYYDVTLSIRDLGSITIHALSWYHLDGFTESGIDTSEITS